METNTRFLLLLLAVSLSSGSPASSSLCNARIVGGYQTEISQIPFQVSILKDFSPTCGGSLISERWVLTAAHCVDTPADYRIRVNSTYGAVFGRVVRTQSTLLHPMWRPSIFDYDFALLELAEEIELSDEFYAAELPEQDEPVQEGTCLQVSGWGLTDDRVPSEELLVTKVPVVNWDECRRAHRKSSAITERMICAGYPEGGIDSCQGDSGGPLVDGRKLVGVVSFGAGCARPGLPGVYARVSAVRSWISFVSDV